MKVIDITVVRIYITEKSGLLVPLLNYLKKEAKIRGVTVLRAITGFGETGFHTASLVDLSLDLPLVVEFFDHPEKITSTLDHLSTLVKAEHITFFPAKANA